ncbi:hypothetical protein LIER_14352 [Lithospermum erythrorhizon]|uniref:Uncharacterized protein n=1 Tax=Lithospermum erythrorhizon TaxID=34254 RepID=A0AAV3Q1D8_LITER
MNQKHHWPSNLANREVCREIISRRLGDSPINLCLEVGDFEVSHVLLCGFPGKIFQNSQLLLGFDRFVSNLRVPLMPDVPHAYHPQMKLIRR